MQIQQFLSAVLALHANMDIGIARKVAARSAFAARQLHADNPDSHTLILTQSRPPRDAPTHTTDNSPPTIRTTQTAINCPKHTEKPYRPPML
ncbi:MAG: hypothetical protein QOI79_4196 [Mycobacterium sp.]|nr:hypothetical protein [Mycobacterium sp.]